jgi:hypothetical protein
MVKQLHLAQQFRTHHKVEFKHLVRVVAMMVIVMGSSRVTMRAVNVVAMMVTAKTMKIVTTTNHSLDLILRNCIYYRERLTSNSY